MAGRRRARRARRTLVAAAVVLAVAAGSSGLAGGQELDPSTSTTAPADPSSSTTSTTAPPSTIVLEDGDFGVVPPGATPPGAPPPGTPPEGTPPGGVPPEGPLPPGGEVPLPEELAVVMLPDPTPGLNAALAAIDVSGAERRLVAAALPVLAAEERTAVARTALRTTVAARRAATEAAVAAKDRLGALAVNVLIYGDPAGLEPAARPEGLDDLRDQVLRDIAAAHVEAGYQAATAELRVAMDAEDVAMRGVAVAERAQHAVEQAHLAARADLERAIEEAREARRRLGPAILGPAVLESTDLVAWYRTFYPVDPPVAPIADIIEAYLAVGAEEGVAGDIAFAQAILETGGFRSGHAGGFNFAGIGAYDHCAPVCGFRFPGLEAGVRAHLHLLRAYADPGLTSARLAAPPDRRVAPERLGVKGCCPRWTALTGVWATDPNYDRKVLGIYRLMVETARALDRQQQ